MKVVNLLNILNKSIKIFEMYKSDSIEKMLDSIYYDLKEFKKLKNAMINKEKERPENINFEDILEELKNKNKEESIELLEKMTKSSLSLLLGEIGLKVKSDSTKVQIVNEIINHFNFIQLKDKMGERK